jgi:tRNA-dihydrouridine synthase A
MLYTEMVTAAALHHGDADRLLRFDGAEHPVALQVGGSDPRLMTEAARLGAGAGYDEININVGCPSDRVRSGRFGACLMSSPDVVAACVAAMRKAIDIPVTVKTRVGIDDLDSHEFLSRFIGVVADAGCEKFIVHARVAILEGLSPKQNRTVPPLNYDRVYALKDEFPPLEIVINGGVTELAQVEDALERVDGVMIGRQAYQDPYFLARLEHRLRPDWPMPGRGEVIEAMVPYIELQLAAGEKLGRIARHLVGLYAGEPGARAWRRRLSENAHHDGAGVEVILDALNAMPMAA